MKRSDRNKNNKNRRLKEIILIVLIVAFSFAVRETYIAVTDWMGWKWKDVEREVIVQRVFYSDGEITVMTRDGMIITTEKFDGNIQEGDSVTVQVYKLSTGELSYKVTK